MDRRQRRHGLMGSACYLGAVRIHLLKHSHCFIYLINGQFVVTNDPDKKISTLSYLLLHNSRAYLKIPPISIPQPVPYSPSARVQFTITLHNRKTSRSFPQAHESQLFLLIPGERHSGGQHHRAPPLPLTNLQDATQTTETVTEPTISRSYFPQLSCHKLTSQKHGLYALW